MSFPVWLLINFEDMSVDVVTHDEIMLVIVIH